MIKESELVQLYFVKCFILDNKDKDIWPVFPVFVTCVLVIYVAVKAPLRATKTRISAKKYLFTKGCDKAIWRGVSMNII